MDEREDISIIYSDFGSKIKSSMRFNKISSDSSPKKIVSRENSRRPSKQMKLSSINIS